MTKPSRISLSLVLLWFSVLAAETHAESIFPGSVRIAASEDTTVALRVEDPTLSIEEGVSSIRVWNDVRGPRRPVFCDLKGTADSTDVIIDFDYTFAVVQSKDGMDPGPWDRGPIFLAGLEGREVIAGTHGCGPRIIRLQWGDDQVVEIRGPNPAELRHSKDRARLLAVAGVIDPDEADRILDNLVQSLVAITLRRH